MNIKVLIGLIVLAGCSSKPDAPSQEEVNTHRAEIEAWDVKRAERLKSATGWLNVSGLNWLEEGINTFGSGESNNIVFPAGKIEDRAGYFLLKQGVVTLEVAPKVQITSAGQPVTSMVIYHPDSARAKVIDHDPLQWHIIKRDDKYGVRLRDFKSPAIENFKGIERYPVDLAWRVTATFELVDSARTIDITNILGQTTAQPSPGRFRFEIQGKEYTLDVIADDEGSDEYFMIFGDQTNASETYGAGRYMYVKKPDAEGKTFFDFNKAYNPPCAFTEFATCPLPPKQNVLDVRITAGEKNYEHK